MGQHKHLYDTRRWREQRSLQLTIEPLCRMCKAEGRLTVATVADHVTPHKGDMTAFFHGELQSLCASHHSRDKQIIERGGKPRPTFDTDGTHPGWK
ncbi:hypothetical protein [Hydrogenophaga sp. IBVHS2]|uniref:hypothetical protein n=1 Tax=Hydrogenophaga sp. IBVHS2 TaxID=1985170 RepID=UPI000A2ECE2C|nr:hypothetical protein [Hydrogenophaga sp. IBVHS2]OSZ66100.1 hypothetical protein CAP38_08785 [Hydrogenophaga sp. IBVHS2]